MKREFLGLRTAIYKVPDIQAGKKWYRTILGFDPYFDQPFYVGFNVGGFELGLVPDEKSVRGNSPVAYWGVADAKTSLQRLVKLGAKIEEKLQDVGEGILVATVRYPWDNAHHRKPAF